MGSCSASSATPAAMSASEVRIQARKVRSLARLNLGFGFLAVSVDCVGEAPKGHVSSSPGPVWHGFPSIQITLTGTPISLDPRDVLLR